jgi:predicted nucleic acid-binding Zn ribbon protein
MDPDIGGAIIACTQAVDEDDVTVGDAWEQLAKTNPRVRAFLLRMLAGGAVGQLVWAHMPILGAILMKDAIRRRIPVGNLLYAFVGDDQEQEQGEAPAEGTSFEGLKQEDMAQMMAMAQAAAEQMMSRGGNGPVRGDDVHP